MRKIICLCLAAALALCCAAAAAETTLYLSDIDTQVTLPDGYAALWTTMGENEESLRTLGMTRRQAVSYLNQQGLLMEAYADEGPDLSLAVMDNDGTDLSSITQRQLQTLVSGIRNSYSQGGSTLEDPGLYRTEHAVLLRYNVQNTRENWYMTEYLFTAGDRVISLQALSSGRRMTSAEQQMSDRVALSLWPESGAPVRAAGRSSAGTAVSLSSTAFKEAGMTIGLPEDYTALTREEILSDTSVNSGIIGMVEASEKIAGVAVAPDNNTEIWILEGKAQVYTLGEETQETKQAVLSAMGRSLASCVLDPDGTARTQETLSSNVFDAEDTAWRLSYEHWDTGSYDEYALLYAGIRNGRELGILFVRYDGEITRTDLETMNKVVTSVRFDPESTGGRGRKSSYTEPASGARFSLPQIWEKGTARDSLRFSVPSKGGITVVVTSADIVPGDSAVARSGYDTTYYSRRDIAEMYDTTFDRVETKVKDGRVFYRVSTRAEGSAYGQTVRVSETDYVTVKDGYMVLMAYIGPEEAQEYREFETMAEGAAF